jgi:pyruvoyl-dependent arginine decarboxylase (PvlArgDC)
MSRRGIRLKDNYTGKFLFGDRVVVEEGFYQNSIGYVIECVEDGSYWQDGKKHISYKYCIALAHDTNSGWISEKHLSPEPPRG